MWDNFKDILKENRGIFSIGFGESAGKIISAIFWFLLAGILGPEKYGEIHYLLAIAGMAQIFALIATSQTMTVYTAKNVKIESTLILISIIAGSIAFLVIIMNFYMFDVAFLVFAFIIFELTNGILLGRRQYSIYSKYFLIQKILLFVLGIGFFYQFGFEGIIFGMALSYVPHLIIILKEMKRTKINFSLLSNSITFNFWSKPISNINFPPILSRLDDFFITFFNIVKPSIPPSSAKFGSKPITSLSKYFK